MNCEKCNKEHDGSYGSGRFCSKSCSQAYVRSFRKLTPEQIKKRSDNIRKKNWERKKNDLVMMYNGDILDITEEQLLEYRKNQIVCEICGKPESGYTFRGKNTIKPNNLTIDHNHKSGKFRGLLCKNCNSRLGWFENHKDVIENYLKKG